MRRKQKAFTILCTSALLLGCSEDSTDSKMQAIEEVWAVSMGEVKLSPSKESKIEGGKCRAGTVSGLTVELCAFKDAVTADSAREGGLAQVGAQTGVSLVRDSLLLVASDPNGIDVHGKKLNQLSKLFLNPETSVAKPFGP